MNARVGGAAPRWRVPLLILGFVALATGVGAGLARLGWPVPDLAQRVAAWHGPLILCGFFGVVIALERAVAIGRRWAYAGPLLAGLGSVALLAGAVPIAAGLYLAGSLVLLAASIDILRRQPALFTLTLVLGAAGWCIGNALWIGGLAVAEVLLWWFTFLILTIAGERLELSRLRPPSARARQVFGALLGVLLLALLAAAQPWGQRLYGLALLVLAGWLFRQDIARRTVRGQGLTRYIAVCLLAGYLWLAVAGAVLLAVGLAPGTAAYDAALHALGLGFVFSMVFGHAPIIFPAVLRVAVPYHASFYLPLLILHASLVMRLAGDALGAPAALRHGALAGALALAVFIATMVAAVWRGRTARGLRRA